jgi:hypothetical protein
MTARNKMQFKFTSFFNNIKKICSWGMDLIIILLISIITQGNFTCIAATYLISSGAYVGLSHQIHKFHSNGII